MPTARTCVSVLKGGTRRGPPLKSRPDPDSVVGGLYDIFLANPAMPISSELIGSAYSARGSRTWYSRKEVLAGYGLDIRHHSRGWWWLVGQWDGSTYIDYIAARLKA